MQKAVKYILLFWGSFFIVVFIMGITRHVYTGGEQIKGNSKDAIVFLSSFLTDVRTIGENKNPQILKSTFQLKDGFNRTKHYKTNQDYLLISSWDEEFGHATIKLIRIRDNRILHKWNINLEKPIEQYNKISLYGVQNKKTVENTEIKNPFLLNDGSLVFNIGSVCKVDKNGKIIWVNNSNHHHSVEQDADGHIWTCSYNVSQKNAKKYQFRDNAIQKLDAKTGKMIFQKSVFEILIENGYNRGILFISKEPDYATGYIDYLHLNDIQPVLSNSKYWKKGDLFISLRDQNFVFLYRPSNNKIIWSQHGPWLKQHDVNIIDSNKISIFGNNVIYCKVGETDNKYIDGHNVQYVYDFSTNTCTTPYNSLLKSSKIRTEFEGRSRILKNGEICIEETKSGRIIYGDHEKEQWSYIQKISDEYVAYINWSRYITEEEFKKFTFITEKKK